MLAGCFQRQTKFMRKNGLAAHIGGWIIELHVNDEGRVVRMIPEWISMAPVGAMSPDQLEDVDGDFFIGTDD